jgi:DNA-binding SARP family transcriptional activator
MEYRILGPLEALDGDRQVSLGGTRQRAVLALLLLHGNETLSRDVIIDSLWGEDAPPTAPKVLQNCVSALRKELPAETIRTVGGAYSLTLGPEELDRDRFERLHAEGRAALAEGAHAEAAERLRAALALWRGSPLADLSYERFTQDEITRLEELQIAAIEDRIDADLGLGLHDELVPELEALVARHPLRERLRGQLMIALYQAGRQAEALEVYRAARRTFMTELGIEPGRALQELERSILAQDPGLEAVQRKGASIAQPGRAAASPLVGRDRELSLLEAGLEDALAGRGRLFVVVGEAGSGKSHLADELASLAKQRGSRILWGRGWDGAPAYWPWTQALRDAGRELEAPAGDDATGQFAFFETVTEMLRGEAAAQSVLLVLDDLQAADEDSIRLLEFVASELPEMPALVLALGRPGTPRLDELGRHATKTLQL